MAVWPCGKALCISTKLLCQVLLLLRYATFNMYVILQRTSHPDKLGLLSSVGCEMTNGTSATTLCTPWQV